MSKKIELSQWISLIQDKLDEGGEVRMVATGVSMKPLFTPSKDEIVLRKEEVHKYDMILYRRDHGQFVVHRIVKEEHGEFVLRGDAQYHNEYHIQPSQVIAKVVGFTRNKKTYTVHDVKYQCYVYVWLYSYPIRRFLWRIKQYLIRKKCLFR